MPQKFHIDYTTCVNETSQVYVKNYIKTHQIFLSRVIDRVEVNLCNGDDIEEHWCLHFLVPFKLNSSFILIVFFEEFI